MFTEVKPLPNPQKIYHLNSNERVFLNDANCIWRVTSGALDVFALHQGVRRYLFSVKPGDLLLPMGSSAPTPTCQLFAQAAQATTLEPFSSEGFQDWLRQEPTVAIAGLEAWVTALSSTAANVAPPILPTPLLNSGILDRGEVFQPTHGQMSWIRLCQGEATLLGERALTITPDCSWLPLADSLWLQATHLVELDRCSHTHLTHAHILLQGVMHLQQLLGQLLETQLQQTQQDELERLYRREQINQDALNQTNARFITLFQSPKRPKTAHPAIAQDFDTALMMATGAVGRLLGVTIQPPSASEDRRRLGNPLDAIARASQLQIRQISLRDEWWTKDCGPMVTYALEDGRPVALLPLAGAAYELYDPCGQMQTNQAPANQTRVRCDRASPVSFLPRHTRSTALYPRFYVPSISSNSPPTV